MATTSTGRSWRSSRIVVASAMTIALTFALGACGGGGGSSEKLTGAKLTAAINSALAQLQRGDIPGAKDSFEKILDSDSKNKYAHYNLGYIAQTTSDRKEAEKQYRAAVESDPKFVPALYNLAIIVTAKGDADEAADLYRQAIDADKNDANSHYNLGLLLRQQGKTGEGNQQIQTAVRLNPALAPQAEAQGVPLKYAPPHRPSPPRRSASDVSSRPPPR